MGLFRKRKPMQETIPQPIESDVANESAQEVAANVRTQELLGGGQTPFAEFLYSEGKIPEGIDNNFVVLINKVLALSNLEGTNDVSYVMTHVDDLITDYKLYTPKRLQTAETFKLLDQLRLYAFLQLQRSTGKKDRDRALLTTISTYSDKPRTKVQRTIFGRVKEKTV